MDDYVREAFVELMQRGIEVDVWPSNTVRVMWLNEKRDCLCIGSDKSSITKQEFHLGKTDVKQGHDDKLIEFATEKTSTKFHVDTEQSQEILIRNLSKLVNNYKNKMTMEKSHSPSRTNEWLWPFGMLIVFVGACVFLRTYTFHSNLFEVFILDVKITIGITIVFLGVAALLFWGIIAFGNRSSDSKPSPSPELQTISNVEVDKGFKGEWSSAKDPLLLDTYASAP